MYPPPSRQVRSFVHREPLHHVLGRLFASLHAALRSLRSRLGRLPLRVLLLPHHHVRWSFGRAVSLVPTRHESQPSFTFALDSRSTIGFGTPDMTFNDCDGAMFVIGFQHLLAIVLNATLAGLLCKWGQHTFELSFRWLCIDVRH